MSNVEVIPSGVTVETLAGFHQQDAALLLNVLHHAGYDFEPTLPRTREAFDAYATAYLSALARTRSWLFFQMGSNQGGDKSNPLILRDAHVEKLRYMSGLLTASGWHIDRVALPTRISGVVTYCDLPDDVVADLNSECPSLDAATLQRAIDRYDLDQFPGEFYKRPLFTCTSLCREHRRRA
jgi:hypothetical protein